MFARSSATLAPTKAAQSPQRVAVAVRSASGAHASATMSLWTFVVAVGFGAYCYGLAKRRR